MSKLWLLLLFLPLLVAPASASLIIADSVNITGNFTGQNETDIIITGTSNAQINASLRNVMLSSSGTTTLIQTISNKIRSFFSGAGTLDANDFDMDVSNMTIATGGTLDAGASTLTVDSNWKAAGGLIGKSALTLNGSGQFVNVTNSGSLNISDALTLDVWMKLTTSPGGNEIVVENNDYSMYFDGSGNLIFSLDATINTFAHGMSTDKWYHVTMTWDGTTAKSYVDGKLMDSDAKAGALSLSNFDIIIGADSPGAGGLYFDGSIARVSLWNRSLSESEIRSIMFQQYSEVANLTGNVGWWQFDEGTGTTVADSSTSGNDGTASDSGVWAGAGTFTYGTSTVNMTGDGTIYYNDAVFYNIMVAPTGKTTTTSSISNDNFNIYGALTLGSGTFTDGADTADILIRGTEAVVTNGATLANIYNLLYITGTANITETTYDHLASYTNDRYLLGNIIVNAELTSGTSGKAIISNGYNITTKTATVTGTLNITAGSSLIFKDTAGAGFGTSAGTLNMIGESGNFANIMSATDPSPTNIPKINASLLTSHICEYVNVYTVNSTGKDIVCLGSVNISAVGSWDFEAATLLLTHPLPDNSTVIEYGSNFTLNWTATDSNLAYMFYNITNSSSYEMNSSEITVVGNTTYTWAKNLTANWGQLGTTSLEISASDDRNKLTTSSGRANARNLVIHIGNTKIGYKEPLKSFKDIQEDNLYMLSLKDKKSVLHIAFSDTNTSADYLSTDNFKMTFVAKTNKDAEVVSHMTANRILYLPNSKYRGHFLYGDKFEYYFDWDDLPDDVNIKVVERNNGYTIILTHKDWKANSWVKLDPVSGGVNKRSETYTFEVIDTTAPTWNQTPADQEVAYDTAFTYTVNATEPLIDVYSINDTANFKINSVSGLIENNTLLDFTIFSINITANDTSGNTLSQVITVNVTDVVAPTVSLISPINYYNTTDTTPNLSYNFTDILSATANCTLTINTTTYNNAAVVNATTTTETSATLSDATYTWNVICIDHRGNHGNSTNRNFTIDTTPPSWEQAPADQTIEFTSAFNYTVNATDAFIGVENLYLNDSTNFKITLNGSATDISRSGTIENITLFPLGKLYLRITVNDSLGNTNSSDIVITTEDTTAPTWNQTPTDHEYELGDPINYKVNASDTGGRTITYTLNDTTYYTIGSSTGIMAKVGEPVSTIYSINITATDPSSNSISQIIEINVTDLTAPTWNQTPTDQTHYSTDNPGWKYKVNASDLSPIDIYSLNETGNYTISTTGDITLADPPTTNTKTVLLIYVNDTFGNTLNASIEMTYAPTPFTNCTAGDIALQVFLRNETDDVNITGEIILNIYMTTPHITNLTFHDTSTQNMSICIYPRDDTYITDINIRYEASGFEARSHYYDNYVLTNETEKIILYLLDEDISTNTHFTILKSGGDPYPELVIEAHKFNNPIAGNHTPVAMGRTSDSGTASMYLEKGYDYNFILLAEGIIIAGFDEYNLQRGSSTDQVTYTVTPAAIIKYFNYKDAFIILSCTELNETTTVECSINQSSEVAEEYAMIVWTKFNHTSDKEERCENYSSGLLVTMRCDVSDYLQAGEGSVTLQISALVEGNWIAIHSDTWDRFVELVYEREGILYAIMLIMLMTGFGLLTRSMVGTLVFMQIGVLLSYYLKLMTFTEGMLGSVTLIIALIIFVVIKK